MSKKQKTPKQFDLESITDQEIAERIKSLMLNKPIPYLTPKEQQLSVHKSYSIRYGSSTNKGLLRLGAFTDKNGVKGYLCIKNVLEQKNGKYYLSPAFSSFVPIELTNMERLLAEGFHLPQARNVFYAPIANLADLRIPAKELFSWKYINPRTLEDASLQLSGDIRSLQTLISKGEHFDFSDQTVFSPVLSAYVMKIVLDIRDNHTAKSYMAGLHYSRVLPSDERYYEGGCKLAVVEDLSENGKKNVVDALLFDYNTLKNGTEVEQQFMGESQRLIALRQKYNIGIIEGHAGFIGVEEADLKKAFHLQIDPKNKIGKLWLGDWDHYEIYHK